MNKLTKRVISAVLTVVLLLSVMVPCVMAAETGEYSFVYKNKVTFPTLSSSTGNANLKNADNAQVLADAYAAGTVNSMPLYFGIPDGQNPWATAEMLSAGGVVGSWIAIKFKSPGSGNYSVEVSHKKESTSPTFDIYMLPGNTAESAISAGTALTSEALLGNYNFYTDNAITAGDFKFEGGQEYIVVFKITALRSGKTSGVFRLIGMNMTLKEAYEAKVVNAEGNTTYYDTAKNALSAAESVNSTVVLLNDATVEEALEIPANVTLDLAGKKLEAPSVKSFGNIIDSSEKDTGVLVSANVEFSSGNSELPLKSGENSYRFFSFTLKSLGRQTNVADKRFWFELTFDAKEEAYNLINSADNAGLEIQFDLYWKGEKLDLGGDVKLASDKVQSWADNMADGQRYGIYVNVTGFPEAGTFGIAPKIVSNGVTYTASTMTYEHTVEG